MSSVFVSWCGHIILLTFACSMLSMANKNVDELNLDSKGLEHPLTFAKKWPKKRFLQLSIAKTWGRKKSPNFLYLVHVGSQKLRKWC